MTAVTAVTVGPPPRPGSLAVTAVQAATRVAAAGGSNRKSVLPCSTFVARGQRPWPAEGPAGGTGGRLFAVRLHPRHPHAPRVRCTRDATPAPHAIGQRSQRLASSNRAGWSGWRVAHAGGGHGEWRTGRRHTTNERRAGGQRPRHRHGVQRAGHPRRGRGPETIHPWRWWAVVGHHLGHGPGGRWRRGRGGWRRGGGGPGGWCRGGQRVAGGPGGPGCRHHTHGHSIRHPPFGGAFRLPNGRHDCRR